VDGLSAAVVDLLQVPHMWETHRRQTLRSESRNRPTGQQETGRARALVAVLDLLQVSHMWEPHRRETLRRETHNRPTGQQGTGRVQALG